MMLMRVAQHHMRTAVSLVTSSTPPPATIVGRKGSLTSLIIVEQLSTGTCHANYTSDIMAAAETCFLCHLLGELLPAER